MDKKEINLLKKLRDGLEFCMLPIFYNIMPSKSKLRDSDRNRLLRINDYLKSLEHVEVNQENFDDITSKYRKGIEIQRRILKRAYNDGSEFSDGSLCSFANFYRHYREFGHLYPPPPTEEEIGTAVIEHKRKETVRKSAENPSRN